MNRNILHLAVLVIIATISCNEPPVNIDFTPEKSFTAGVEGPATDANGNIYAVNFKEQGTIGRVTPKGEASLFVELPNGSIGNGIRFSKEGKMLVADYINHNILQIDLTTKIIEIYAHGPKANQPNDLAVSPKNVIYASDPNWSDNTGNLWMVTKDQGFTLLEEGMGTTNGVEVSPRGDKLYVNESVQRNIWVYDILESGRVNNKKKFTSFKDFGLDGMRCHTNGNLYVTRYDKGTVAVLSPKGELLKEINLIGKKPTNLTFSNDYKKIYVTVADRGCIETYDF